MTSRARAVLEAHQQAIDAGDLDAVVAGYAEDAVVVAGDRIGRGRDYVRSVFATALEAVRGLSPTLEILDDGDVVVVRWTAHPDGSPPLAGVDTFVMAGDLIAVHTGFSVPVAGPDPG